MTDKSLETNKAYFAAAAASYDNRPPKEIEMLHGKAAEIVAEELGLPSTAMRLIELGSGTGLVTLPVAPKAKEVVTVDLSPDMTKQLEGKLSAAGLLEKVHTHCGDITSAETQRKALGHGGPLDGAYSVMTLHHVADIAAALTGVAATLRAGAKVVLVDLEWSPLSTSFHKKAAWPSVCHHGFTEQQFADALEKAGFTGITVRRGFTISKPLEDSTEMREFGFLVAVASKK